MFIRISPESRHRTMMKLTLAFLAVVLAACQVIADVPAFTIDRQYRYAYKSRAVTGIAQDVMQFSGIGLKGDVVLQNQGNSIYVKFENVQYGNFNNKVDKTLNEEFDMPYMPIEGPSTFVREALTKPVRVTVEKGLVKSFDVYPEDPEWSVNIKRAILSLFQLNFDRVNSVLHFSKTNFLKTEDNRNFYRVMEDGIGGDCETAYQIQSTPYFAHPNERVLNVTKHRFYDRCSRRPVSLHSSHMGYKCEGCDAVNIDPLKSISRTEYQIRGDRQYYTIEKIFNTGKFIFTPFTTNSETILSGVNQTLSLLETTPIREAITFPERFRTFSSLTYNLTVNTPIPTEVDLTKPNYYNRHFYHTYNNYMEQGYQLLKELATKNKLTDDLYEKHAPQKLVQLIKIFGSLSQQEIVDFYTKYLTGEYAGSEIEEIVRLRQTFFSTIASVGSNPAVKFLLDLTKTATDNQKTHLSSYFATVPFFVKDPSEKLIEEFLTTLKTVDRTEKPKLYTALWLAFGTLVHRGCERTTGQREASFHHGHAHVYRVRSETCKRYVKLVQTKLEESTTTWQQMLYIKVANNLGLADTYTFLRPIATGHVHYPIAVRLQSFWSMFSYAHELREEVLAVAVQVFLNHTEPEKIRIAAYELMVAARPGFSFWESVSAHLHKDPSMQVQNYVYSSLVAYSNSTNPCHQTLRRNARKVLDFLKAPALHGHHYSRLVLFNYLNDKYGFGGETLLSYMGSNESLIPENLYMKQTAHILGYNFDYFSIHASAKGFSEIYEQVFGPNGIFSSTDMDKSLLNIFRRHPRNVDTVQKELDEIRQTVNIKQRQLKSMQGSYSVGMFNQIFKSGFFNQNDIPSYKENGYFYLPKELPAMLRDGFPINVQKMMLVADVMYEVPTELGFPLAFSVQVPGIFSVHGNIKVDVQPGFFPEDRSFKRPTNVKVVTALTPTFHTQIITEVGIRTPMFNTYGYGVTHDMSAKFPLNVNIDYDLEEKKLRINYVPAKTPFQMLNYKVKPFTFADKKANAMPLTNEANIKPIMYIEEPHKIEYSFGQKYFGAGLRMVNKQQNMWSGFSYYYKYLTSFFTRVSRTFDSYDHSYNLIHRITSGLLSMRDYIIYYPSLRPASFKLYYEPSTENPTNDYDLTIDVDVIRKTNNPEPYIPETTGQNLIRADPSLRTVYGVHVDLVANGAVRRKYHADLNLTYAGMSEFPQKISMDYYRTPVPNYDDNTFKVCYRASLKTPAYTSYYSIDKTVEPKAELTQTIQFGENCASEKKIEITARFEKTEEQKMYDQNPTMYRTYQTCEEDKSRGFNYSRACWDYFVDYHTLKKYNIDVTYQNLPKYFTDAVYMQSNWFKSKHFTNIAKLEFVNNEPGRVKMVMNLTMKAPAKVDIAIHQPTRNVLLKNIYYPDFLPVYPIVNLKRTPKRVLLDKIFGYNLSPMCVAQNDHILTFDHVEYKTPLSACYHIFAKDCSAADKFTLLLKEFKHQTYNKAMKLFVAGHKIEILPVGVNSETSPLIVRVDDVKQPINQGNLFYISTPEIRLSIKLVGNYYKIKALSAGITVYFNGVTAKLMASNTYRGRVCGLCGDLNGERTHEFTGPSGCVYHKPTPFVYSYIIPDGTCTVPEMSTMKKECFYPHAPKYPGKCTMHRNKVIHNVAINRNGLQVNSVCFSTMPIPECLAGCKPTTYVKRNVSFHCLNTRDEYSSILVRESKIRQLPELLKKSEDYNEVVHYPENCIKA